MNIIKQARQSEVRKVTPQELEQINAMSRRELGEEEVYLFCVRLCDNEVDRDGERFSAQTLEELAPMFVGRSGIFDHNWSAKGQMARVYRCEVVREEGVMTQAGECYCWLKGYAYILRSEGSAELIEQIEAGIKKEVSVGCSVERKVCSICGCDVEREGCAHRKGERYDGRLCFHTLEGAKDAYEFSFVAVPAQPAAGVVKGWQGFREMARSEPEWERQMKALEQEAAVGRACMQRLKEDVVRLGLLSGLGMQARELKEMAEALGYEQLEQLRKVYGAQAAVSYPVQLSYNSRRSEARGEDEAFMI